MKANPKTISLRSLGILALLCTVGCGRWASAPEQETVTVPIPEYPSFDRHVLSLTDGSAAVGYGGTMLLFNENTTGDLIADVLQASIDSRRAWGESKRFEEENRYILMYAPSGIIPETVNALRNELRQFEAEALARTPVPLEAKRTNTRTWFQGELDRLYGAENSGNKERAERMFGYYCDAKLMELATNSNFAANKYLDRPSPLGFCESYYEEQGYFQSEACEADPAGKSYFECLWRDGVFHTHWFADELLNPELSETRANAIASLLDEENLDDFRRVIALDQSYMALSAALQRLIFGPNGDLRSYFANIIMEQTRGAGACARVIPDLTIVCDQFAVTRLAVQPQSGLGANEIFPLSPAETINVMEERISGASSFFQFPNRPESEVSTKEILAYFGQRNSSNHGHSDNDRHLHQLASGETLGRPILSDRLTGLTSAVQRALSGVVYPSLSAADRSAYNARLARIEQLEQDRLDMRRAHELLQLQITESSAEGFRAGAAGDREAGTQVAHAFVELRLKVVNRGGLIRTYFRTGDSRIVSYGCFDSVNNVQLSENDCPPQASVDGISGTISSNATRMYVDPNSGRLDFGFLITDPRAMGLGYKARAEEGEPLGYFMDFEDDALLGKELVFELFPNRIFDHLEVLTGKAFIYHAGLIEYEAGISLWDQNL